MAMTIRQSRRAATGLAAFAASALACIATGHAADPDKAVDKIPTASPIKHVIIIVGENRSFDHLFATYVPKSKHERVLNLLAALLAALIGSSGLADRAGSSLLLAFGAVVALTLTRQSPR